MTGRDGTGLSNRLGEVRANAASPLLFFLTAIGWNAALSDDLVQVLRPQDVVVALKLAIRPAGKWSYAELGHSLALSAGEVHNAVMRAVEARLLVRVGRERPVPARGNLLEFLVHGVRYSFPAARGGLSRGFPTGHAAPGLADLFAATGEPPPVWPDPDGTTRGFSLSPLHPSAVKAAVADAGLYRLLAAVDLVRDGGARERGVGEKTLAEALGAGGQP